MRIEHRIIAISFVLGLVVWVLDTLVDHLVFYKGTFWGLLYPDASAHEIYMRSLILSLFVGFGIVLNAHRPLTRNRVEVVNFTEPGTYLVICTVPGHFSGGMYGYVKVFRSVF